MSDEVRQTREHRIPKKARDSFPSYWVMWYTWRRFLLMTPRVRNSAVQVVVSIVPTRWWLIGLCFGRDEDEELNVRLGFGVVEVEFQVIKFWPESYWTERLDAADA